MVDRESGVAGLAGDPANPPRGPGPLGRHAAAAFRTLGWHCWPADMALVTTDFDGRPGCVDCGLCQAGCPRGSLRSADVCLRPRGLRYGVDLRPNCRVERIVLGPDGRASGAVYIDRQTGLRYEQRAEVVIVCGNGIGTPRLLLLSAVPACPEGLANSSGMVARHLMLHAVGAVEYWLDAPTEGYKGVFGFPLASFEFAETDPRRGCVSGVMLQVLRSFGPAVCAPRGGRRPRGEPSPPWYDQAER